MFLITWMELVVLQSQPFYIADDEILTQHINVDYISDNNLIKHMDIRPRIMELKSSTTVPDNFSLALHV